METVNNSNENLDWCFNEILASLKRDRAMPEELQDTFSVKFIKIAGKERAIIDLI